MAIDIVAPIFPESVSEGLIVQWHKQVGDFCEQGEIIVDVETDKVVLEVAALENGTVQGILKQENETVASGEVMGRFEPGSDAKSSVDSNIDIKKTEAVTDNDLKGHAEALCSPAARKIADERGIKLLEISGTGKGGRITKEDVLGFENGVSDPNSVLNDNKNIITDEDESSPGSLKGSRVEKRVPMTRMRVRVAERLLGAQHNAAMLTTFNEVDMSSVMQLRTEYKDIFEKRYNVRLGFMSFFVKAAVEALKLSPIVNASIDGGDIVYHGYQDVGVAVSSQRGLVVPVLRNAEYMSLAEIEGTIRAFGQKAQEGKLGIEDMTGGTFTISNGGVFGSLLSTPIINPPQSAILGMHKIQERPMAVAGEVKILPMMYLALSYDHRLLDGKEAVSFLVTLKEYLEEPARMLLEV